MDGQDERVVDGALDLPEEDVALIRARFTPPEYEEPADCAEEVETLRSQNPDFDTWMGRQLAEHKQPGYAIVNISCTPIGKPPGDISSDQMEAVVQIIVNYLDAPGL